MRYLFLRYLFVCPLNGLKNVCVGIKTIELVKQWTMFQRKMEDFKGK